MLKKPQIKNEMQDYIRMKLSEIEKIHRIKIILAIESGSRAWGFPSIDSDYDIRFIYVRPIRDYLSVRDFNDHLETPIIFDETLGVPFDLNGWDLRKALKLSIKSNIVLLEWLVSPIVYINHESSLELLNFTKKSANLDAFLYHYDRLARSSWNQIQQDSYQVKTKLYCYALRPIIAMLWILQHNDTPPMDMFTLCHETTTDSAVLKEICSLVERKATVKETDLIPRNYTLDFFINSVLQNEAGRFSTDNEHINDALEEADRMLYKSIRLAFGNVGN